MQQWFKLSDAAAEEALYDSRRFARVDLGRAQTPEETTICKFRHLLEAHDLGAAMLDEVNRCLENWGIRIATGIIVDAPIIMRRHRRRTRRAMSIRRCTQRASADSGISG